MNEELAGRFIFAPAGDPELRWQQARQEGYIDDDFDHVWVVISPDSGVFGVYAFGALADRVEALLPESSNHRVEKHRLQSWVLRQEM